MSIQKKNDWAVTLLFNPDKSIQDLANLGITVETSDIKDKEYYKSYPEIQEYFTQDGKFNDVAFNNFYNSALSLYNSEENKNLESDFLSGYEYDAEDLLAPAGSKVLDTSARIVKYYNPTRSSRGISNLDRWGAPTMSEREVAQTQKIYDPATGKFEDWTPNSLNVFSSLSAPTLVLAKWDEDGIHEENGMTVRHYKGQTKYNDDGDPYYEKLNGRSVDGKEVLHAFDIMTVDGSKWNKYDFFDSDGLDKSLAGSIFQTVAKVAPAFIPYANIGTLYTAFTSAIELGKFLPVLYKSIHGIATNDNEGSKSVKVANNIQGWFSKFDTNTSDKGREGFWNAENVLNIAASSGLQLKQQRLIGEIPKMIAGGKDSYNTIKWGRALSLSYMVGTSSTQSYEAFKEAGASDMVAGLGTIATMFAMKKLMDNDYFREFWYDGTSLSKHEYNKAIKSATDQVIKNLNIGAKPTQKQTAKWILDAEKMIVDTFNKVNKTKLFSGALNEGLEEMGEEFASDMVKASMNTLNYLGLVDRNRDYDFGTTLDDIATRYSAAFFGGGIGGAVFSLHDRIASSNKNIAKNSGNDPWFQEMIYLIRNGRGDRLRSELKSWHNKGKLGSTSLSAIDHELASDESGVIVNYKSAKEGESHNDIVYNQVLNLINRIESILGEENLNITDDDLDLIRQANPELEKVDNEGVAWLWKSRVLDHRADQLLKDESIVSKIYQDWNDLSQNILSTKLQMEEMLKPDSTSSKTPKDVDTHIASILKDSRYIELQNKLNSLRLERDKIILGHKNDYYYGQMSFLLQPDLAAIYGAPIGLDNFSKDRFGKLYNELTSEERTIIDRDFSEYTKLDERNKAYRAYDIFYNISERFSKKIAETAEKIAEYTSLFDEGNTEYSKRSIIITKELEYTLSQLEKVKSESDLDKIPVLEQKASRLQLELDSLNKSKSIQTSRALSSKGQSILKRYEDPNEKLTPAEKFSNNINNYLIWLNYLKSNNLFIEPDDADLQSILLDLADSIESNNDMFEDRLKTKILSLNYGVYSDYVGDNLRGIRKKAILNLRNGDLNGFIYNIGEAQNDELIEDPYDGSFDDELLDMIFGITSDGQRIVDIIRNIQDLRSSLTVSPIYGLLKEIAEDINPALSSMVDMVLSDLKNLPYIDSLEDYIISDPHALSNLKLLKSAIAVANSLIYTGNDLNADMNKFRVDKELLTVITDPVREIAKNEFDNIDKKVSRLIEIAEANGKQKLREQKYIMFNMRKKFGDILTSKDSTLRETFAKAFNIDIDSLIQEFGLESFDVTEENYSEYESAIIKFEDAIYSEVRKNDLNVSDVINKVVSLFNWEELLHRKPTKMVKDPKAIVADYDKMIYLLSIIANPSSDFYNKLKTIISDDSFDKAPVFGQEYIAKISYSLINYPELANELLTKLQDLAYVNEDDEYLKSKPSLYNVVSVVSGGAGSGKTNGVDRIIYDMIKDDSDVVVCAPTERQTNILESALRGGKKMTKSELLKSIIGKESLDKDDIVLNKENKVFDINPNIKINKNNIFGTKNKKVLFIDEYSLFNKPELEVISKWAVKNGVLIIFSGDQKQNKSVIEYKEDNVDKYALSGIEDFIFISTPELNTSLRINNLAKVENYNSLNSILSKVYDEYYADPKLDSQKLSGIVHDELEAHPVTLKFFESDNTFGGEKLILENEIDNYIKKLSSLSSNVAIISDHPEKYTQYHVKIIDIKSVQGDEFDYVIIDKDWSYNAHGIKQDSFNRLSDLYALTQRSTEGTIIVNKSLGDLSLKNVQDNNASGRVVMNKDQIKSFKDSRLKGLGTLSETNVDKSKFKSDNIQKPIVETVSQESPAVVLPPLEDLYEEAAYKEPKVSSPVKERKVSPALKRVGEYIVSDTITGKDIKLHFENMYNIFKTSFNKVNPLSSIKSESKIRKIYLGLSSYYKYGYYKDNNTSSLYDYLYRELKSKKDANRIIAALSDAKLYLIPYSYNNKNTSVLTANIKFGNADLNVPLMVANNAVSEKTEFNGDINPTFVEDSRDQISSNGEESKVIYGSEFEDIGFGDIFRIVGDPMILSKSDDLDFQDKVSKERFYRDNVGKTMMVISSDTLSSQDDYWRFVRSDKENLFTLTQDPRFRIIGVNKHIDSSEQLFELVSKLKGSENYNILSKNTLAKVLSSIYSIDQSVIISKIAKQIFINHPDWYIKVNGQDNIYKSESDLKTIDWNSLETFEIFRESKETTYKVDNSLFIKEFMTKRFHDAVQKDENIFNIINKIINTQQFVHGIKLNDKLLYGSHVTEDSMWYNIGSKNGVPYTTDIIDMYEPNFELIFKSDESAINEDNNIEINTKREETVNDIKPIEQRIKEYVNDDNAILEFIDDSDSDLWKTKLVFVTSQSGRGLYRVNDSSIKIVDDSNIIANVETIRSYINMLSQITGAEQLIEDIIKYYNNAINGLDVNDEFYSMKIPEWNYNGDDVANAIDELILSNDRFCII